MDPADLDAFAQNYNIAGAVPPPPAKPSKGNSFDFASIVVQSAEDFARLPESQKQLLRNMKQGIQYTPQAAAEFIESFNTRLMEQSTPKAQAEAEKAQLDIQKAELDLKISQADIAQVESRKQAAATEIAGMRSMLAELKSHSGLSASVGAKGPEYLFGVKKEPFSGTRAADFYTLLEQVQGGTFMQAFNNLKGAGQITEQEGAKATAAIARLNPRQSEEGFNKALMDFDGVLAQAQARSQSNAAQQPAAAAPQAAPAQPQQPATRTIRGQTFVQQPNGNWIPQ
jgi:hypothetical protein